MTNVHDDVIKWEHFPRYWPLCGEFNGPRWIPHTKASDAEFSLICVWINGWVSNDEASDLRRYRAYYDHTVMHSQLCVSGYAKTFDELYLKAQRYWNSGPRFNIKFFFQVKDSSYKDKMVVRPSFLYNENSSPGKSSSVYWDSLGSRSATGSTLKRFWLLTKRHTIFLKHDEL